MDQSLGSRSYGEGNPIEALEEVLRNARPIPLTDSVRVDRTEAQFLLQQIRDATRKSADLELVDELESAVLGWSIPLSNQCRADLKRAQRALAELRKGSGASS